MLLSFQEVPGYRDRLSGDQLFRRTATQLTGSHIGSFYGRVRSWHFKLLVENCMEASRISVVELVNLIPGSVRSLVRFGKVTREKHGLESNGRGTRCQPCRRPPLQRIVDPPLSAGENP